MLAKAFLSHSSEDERLVNAVADSLCRRGIIAWKDKNQLTVGDSLTEKLTYAIENQTAFVLFLSAASLKSGWVERELALALELEAGRKGWILPVYLGEPSTLVNSSPLLCKKWLTTTGQVDRLGIQVDYPPRQSPETTARRIAEQLSSKLYQLINIKIAREITLYLDQRGDGGKRTDIPDLPEELQPLPTLVFRPSTGNRTREETLTGAAWSEFITTLSTSLGYALGADNAGRKIHLLGKGQLGLAYFLGYYFDRTSHALLYCRNQHNNTCFTNAGQDFSAPPGGGNANCEQTTEYSQCIDNSLVHAKLALYVGNQDYLPWVYQHLQATHSTLPLVFVNSLQPEKNFTTSSQVMDLISNLIALLRRLKAENRTGEVLFFTGLPFNALILVASQLRHLQLDIRFMELEKQKKGVPPGEQYTWLPMTTGE